MKADPCGAPSCPGSSIFKKVKQPSRETRWLLSRASAPPFQQRTEDERGKWRPVEPGSFPLAHGLPRSLGKSSAELQRLAEMAGLDGKSLARAKAYRVGTLGGFGNAINIEQATEFVRVYLDGEAINEIDAGMNGAAE